MSIRPLFVLLIIFLLALSIASCKEELSENKTNNEIVISLESKGGIGSIIRMSKSFKFLDSIKSKEFKGIIKNDSSFVTYLSIVNTKEVNRLLNENIISQELYDSIKTRIYCLTGFKNGMQYYCMDENGNKDFGDDKMNFFDKSFAKEIFSNYKLQDSFPINKIEIVKIENRKLYKDTLYLKIYPDTKSTTFSNETEFQKFQHTLLINGQSSNYLYGEFSISNVKYKVAIANASDRGGFMLFNEKDSVFRRRMGNSYYLSDTMKINNSYYKIDSLSKSSPKLTLKKMNNLIKEYGFRKGEKSKNFKIEDLEGNESNFKKAIGNKKLLLIDFWGTWCGPCKELTPDLINLHKRFGDNVSFMSLAFELDPEPVRQYAIENNMNWYQGIIKGKPKSGDMSDAIIGGLRIECYPTFLVLDKELNILFRGCGGEENFDNLVEFIEAY